MKYIITEEQQNKLIEIILRYLDSNLVPQGGWKDKKYYQKEMDQNYEMFFMFNTEEEDFGWGESDHMYYTQCDNPNLDSPIREEYCPLISIDSKKYDSLDGYFFSAGNLSEAQHNIRLVFVDQIQKLSC